MRNLDTCTLTGIVVTTFNTIIFRDFIMTHSATFETTLLFYYQIEYNNSFY